MKSPSPSEIDANWQTLFLPPEDIATDPVFELPGRGKRAADPVKEKKLIGALAEDIGLNKQLYEGLVVTGPKSDPADPTYVIYDGHRRRAAIIEYNKRNPKSPLLMRVRLDPTPFSKLAEIRRKSIATLIQRLELSPVALAELCQQVRKDNGWEDKKHTQKVADYLNVDQATVTTHEKLLTQLQDKPELRARVEDGVVSAAEAMNLATQPEDVALQIIDHAATKQAERRQAEGKAPQKRVESPDIKAATRTVRDSIRKDKEKAAASGDTKTAAKLAKVETQLENIKVRRGIKDLVAVLNQMDSPVYGGESSDARQWARYFRDKWVPGDGTDRTLLAKLDGILTAGSRKTSPEDKAKQKAAEEKAAKAGAAVDSKVAKGGKK